jgi:hypothetical protein
MQEDLLRLKAQMSPKVGWSKLAALVATSMPRQQPRCSQVCQMPLGPWEMAKVGTGSAARRCLATAQFTSLHGCEIWKLVPTTNQHWTTKPGVAQAQQDYCRLLKSRGGMALHLGCRGL